MQEKPSRRNVIIGAITIAALVISFALALLARRRVDVPVVIVAPVGTDVTFDGRSPRVLPQQPNTSNTLASFYFLAEPGDHEVRFVEPLRPPRVQSITISSSRVPVIFTLLRDTLREMQSATR